MFCFLYFYSVNNSCPNCNSEFQCSANQSCWCMEFPPIISADATSCYCSNCLKIKVQAKIKSMMADLDKHKSFIQGLGEPKTLQEGIDYNTSEEGLMVLTSWFLLRRGDCCDNNCQNCPYPK